MKKIIAIALVAFSLLVGSAYACTYQFPISESANTEITGGVIRIDPDRGVYLLTDSSHHSIGIKDVYIDETSGALVVEKYEDVENTVVTTAVTADETLARKGITVGLSGGGKISKVFFYNENGTQLKLHGPIGFETVASPTANIWFMSVSHKQ